MVGTKCPPYGDPGELITSHHTMKRILLPVLFFLHAVAAAAALQLGEPLPLINLTDQNDKPVAIAPDTKIVFFTSEMGGSRLMTEALHALPPATLKDKNAVYIADITGMPAIFTTIVAMPRLQKAAYPVALIRDSKQGASLPRKPGAVTVLRMDGGKVSTVEFVKDSQQIKRHLK
jgi:NADPH-dependent ferric siderophore reductase